VAGWDGEVTSLKGRPLPRRDLCFTELGFGGAPIGNLGGEVTAEDADAVLAASWQGGIRYFDTAPHYGLGLSERRMGEALRRRARDEFCLSTKVGRILEPVSNPLGLSDTQGFSVGLDHRRRWDFSRDGVRRSLDSSLQRLGLDRIDVVLVHDPDDHWPEASSQAIPALVELRDQGVIRAVGVGINQSAMAARFVRETDIDVVMIAGRYSLLDQTALAELLPAAQEHGVGVIAAGIFNSGLLARYHPDPNATFDYAPAPPEMLDRVMAMAEICREFDTTLPAAAVHFALAHPAVVTAVLGMRTAAETRRNLALPAAPPPPGFWEALREKGLLSFSAPTAGWSP
jgi:D-threo-aldose 1-dehydrogenase